MQMGKKQISIEMLLFDKKKKKQKYNSRTNKENVRNAIRLQN